MMLHYVDDLEHDEIVTIRGSPPALVQWRIFEQRGNLQRASAREHCRP